MTAAVETEQPTGWELSAAVAREVLGCRVVDLGGVKYCGCGKGEHQGVINAASASEFHCEGEVEYPLADYHEEIGAAWEIVEKAAGWADNEQVMFTGLLFEGCRGEEVTITAELLLRVLKPEAICWAALRVVRNKG